MPTLEVPGAQLHYETVGSGRLLLLIPGADGHGGIFSSVVGCLSQEYTVVSWDRRGFSKSFLKGPQQFSQRLLTDVQDAYRLIRHLSTEPAIVFGTSSGAIVALNLLIHHPESVTTLVAHEPPALSVLPEQFRDKATGLVQHIYDTYRAKGPAAAMELFTNSGLAADKDSPIMRAAMDGSRSDEIRANSFYWFEFELRQYTNSELDVNIIKANKEKFIPVAGEDSGNGLGVGPVSTIAAMVGTGLRRVPGGHLGYVTNPKAFADALLALIG